MSVPNKIKGLDDFTKKFLTTNTPKAVGGQIDDVEVTSLSGMKLPANKEVTSEFLKKEFIKRAGLMAEDLIGFFVTEKQKRSLTDAEAVFAVALTTINLRHAYGSPQTDEERKTMNASERANKLAEFDEICEAAQSYFDAHKDD